MDIIQEISNKTVSISEFNRGQAGKIFDEVKVSGPKVVLKNNTPEAVVISPDQYSKILQDLEDAMDLALAAQRMESVDKNSLTSLASFAEEFGINFDEIEPLDESEFV